jgi:CheY-like chemotaxis protein
MMPGPSGLDICRDVRSRSAVPIIVLTAKDAEVDKVVGLGFAIGRRTQKVLPSPSTDWAPIWPPITSTIRRAIARPRPKPSCLRDSLRR